MTGKVAAVQIVDGTSDSDEHIPVRIVECLRTSVIRAGARDCDGDAGNGTGPGALDAVVDGDESRRRAEGVFRRWRDVEGVVN